ncbi:portal protein [Microbacterium phage AluminumJesus]|nr:portal protein [Microbacterium phage AluminumJesus]
MPRRERVVRGRSLTAAAKNISFRKSPAKAADTKLRQGEEWQHAAWDFYDLVPEYHQGCAITGALLSRAKLVVVERTIVDGKPVWKPSENPVAVGAMGQLYGGEEGQVEMLRQLGIHFSVAGGGYLVGPTKADKVMDPDKWMIAASTELTKSGNTYRLGGKELENVFAIELFKRHPRNHRKYDAPTRSILPVLALSVQLLKRSAAQIDSRLTGNGMVVFPSETEFPAVPTRGNYGDPAALNQIDSISGGDAQGLMDLVQEIASIAIADQSSPEATLPIFASTPGEYIDKIQKLDFSSALDAAMPAHELALIRRIALGMDMPPEVLLGNAGSNHWNAWLSDENSVKIHAEPLLKIVTSSLTTGYLRVGLEGLVEDPTAFAIAADTSQMRMRPNRSKESLELYKLGILSEIATRRENGFDEADAPSDEERQTMLLWRVASGSTTPELVNAALKEEGVDLGVIVSDFRRPAEARPLPSTADHPVRELPERAEPAAAAGLDGAKFTALVYAAEQMVDRALQRAGNRMKTKYGMRNSTTAANRLHLEVMIRPEDCAALLEDAWGCTQTTADLVDPAALTRALDFYTRSLIVSRREPSRASLAAALKLLLTRTAG